MSYVTMSIHTWYKKIGDSYSRNSEIINTQVHATLGEAFSTFYYSLNTDKQVTKIILKDGGKCFLVRKGASVLDIGIDEDFMCRTYEAYRNAKKGEKLLYTCPIVQYNTDGKIKQFGVVTITEFYVKYVFNNSD